MILFSCYFKKSAIIDYNNASIAELEIERFTRFQKQNFLPIKSCFHPLLRTTSFTIISKIAVSSKNRGFCENCALRTGP